MSRDDFTHGMRVLHVKARRSGTVVNDFYRICLRSDVPVQFDGCTGFEAVTFTELMPLPKGGWLDPSLLVAIN